MNHIQHRVHAANWDEAVITLTPAAGKIVVAEPAPEEPEVATIDYTTATYDIAATKLSVNYAAPSQAVKDVLAAYKAAGNRVVKLVVKIGEAEFLFNGGLSTGGGTLSASGFALPHMNTTVALTIRVTADGLDTYEFNAYEIVIADYLAEQAGDAKVDAVLALNKVWAAGNETIAINNAEAEDGLVDYTTATYDTETSKVSINYAAPSDEFKNAYVAANANKDRVAQLVVKIGEAEFLFDAKMFSAGGTWEASGFSLSHFTQPVSMFLRVSNGTGLVFETNAIEVNLDSVMKAAEGSAFASAYVAYANS